MEGSASAGSPWDPYRVLGVGSGASQQDIARAYRRAARHAHPDKQPADPGAAARFQALTDAYDLLSDAARREDYDRTHRAAGPSSQPHPPGTQHRHPAPGPPWPGSPCPPPTAFGPPVWAGPVHVEPAPAEQAHAEPLYVEPPAARSRQERAGSRPDFEDPPVILGIPPGQGWRWLW